MSTKPPQFHGHLSHLNTAHLQCTTYNLPETFHISPQ